MVYLMFVILTWETYLKDCEHTSLGLQNVSIAYIGMIVGGDYIFSMLNFIGLNIW